MLAIQYLTKKERVELRRKRDLKFLWSEWEKWSEITQQRDTTICCTEPTCCCMDLEDKRLELHPNGLYEKHKWRKPNVLPRNYRYDLVLNEKGQIMVK